MDRVEGGLSEAEKHDAMVTGRFFAYLYETGDKGLKEVAFKALVRFYDKNMLDFTVYRSAVFFEREVVGFARRLLHGGEEVVGTFTYGGTES